MENLEVAGSLEPFQRVKIFSEVSGVLKERNFEIGDQVEKDTVIARIDEREFEAQYLMADADLKIAAANLQKAKKGPRDQDISAARATVEQVSANEERLKEDFERLADLYRRKNISQSQYNSAEKAWQAANALRKAAEAGLSAVLEGTRSEDLLVAEAAYQAAQGRYRLAELTYKKTEIKAPIKGFITERNIETGDFVLPATNPMGKMLCGIIDIDQLYFVGRVNERYLISVNVGDKIEVRVPVLNVKCQGTVAIIDPSGNTRNRDFLIKILIDNKDHKLHAGMFAMAELVLAEANNAVVIPYELILGRDQDQGYVFVAQGNRAQKRVLNLGIRAGRQVEVNSGLQENDQLIVKGYSSLTDDSIIKILDKVVSK
jgi:multidrug efflux pump subunit AcrA (membrane-fusion protein)